MAAPLNVSGRCGYVGAIVLSSLPTPLDGRRPTCSPATSATCSGGQTGGREQTSTKTLFPGVRWGITAAFTLADIRDLPCFGRPARLVWLKRRWRCVDQDCVAKTWTEGTEHVAPRAVLTLRGKEATRQVGELAMPVAVVARELGVCWWTVMDAVVLHGTPLVEDPGRVGKIKALGIDETSFLRPTGPTRPSMSLGWWI